LRVINGINVKAKKLGTSFFFFFRYAEFIEHDSRALKNYYENKILKASVIILISCALAIYFSILDLLIFLLCDFCLFCNDNRPVRDKIEYV